jgi:catechol 2,3-dioxygenase-like lactoylglutathione lyase family enzyme
MVKAALMHHMNLAIDDVEKARDFYGRVLGLQEIKRPATGRLGLWFGCADNELHFSLRPGFQGGRTAMSLYPAERPGRLGGHVAFTMEGSLDDIAKHLEAEAIPYARGTAGLPQIFCEDPAGNLIEINTGWAQEPIR